MLIGYARVSTGDQNLDMQGSWLPSCEKSRLGHPGSTRSVGLLR
jgi:hypothetical protein